MTPTLPPPPECADAAPPTWVLLCALLLGVLNATVLTLDTWSR